ncbi:MAG: AbrB/MazE/SpoVT family DNA-binding domain-containing protein [Candidatus Aenigmarchaeota archaeon]|nr:AbrB/MazE/SpoVT family DNA-binding domain-containing protein [Candidatus Aenigmarchaeota archaeon]
MEVEITRISPKGQVVIPSRIRRDLDIEPADKFLVFGEKDIIVFKKIEKPTFEKTFKEISEPLQKVVKRRGFKRKDLDKLIKDTRKRKKR